MRRICWMGGMLYSHGLIVHLSYGLHIHLLYLLFPPMWLRLLPHVGWCAFYPVSLKLLLNDSEMWWLSRALKCDLLLSLNSEYYNTGTESVARKPVLLERGSLRDNIDITCKCKKYRNEVGLDIVRMSPLPSTSCPPCLSSVVNVTKVKRSVSDHHEEGIPGVSDCEHACAVQCRESK